MMVSFVFVCWGGGRERVGGRERTERERERGEQARERVRECERDLIRN
jgi:hypothetical protein